MLCIRNKIDNGQNLFMYARLIETQGENMEMMFHKTYPKNGSLEIYLNNSFFGVPVMMAGNDCQLDDEEMEKDLSFFETKSKITFSDLKNRGFQSK